MKSFQRVCGCYLSSVFHAPSTKIHNTGTVQNVGYATSRPAGWHPTVPSLVFRLYFLRPTSPACLAPVLHSLGSSVDVPKAHGHEGISAEQIGPPSFAKRSSESPRVFARRYATHVRQL